MEIILIAIASFYIIFSVLFYFFQHFIFFRPEILPSSFKYNYPFPFTELEFDTEDGGRINGIYFKVPSSRGVVFYLKGNSRSVKGWGKFAKDFLSNGYDFVMIDYRGFGKSRGKRSQSRLFNDTQFMYKWLSERYKEDDIVLYGRSLGSGIAARIASWNNPRLLILDSPYYSFYHNTKRFAFWAPLKWILRYDIRTDQYLKTVNCPVQIIHGTKDRLFPFSQSEKLQALFPKKIKLAPIEGAHHNNLPDYPAYYQTLYDSLNKKSN
ncbi:MAG: alpha/beta hydrolase [Cyclobacteriaceae bacterium]|nr:alpha/beta hydrolase [Cyclobacteriaceae bacterium]